LGFSAALAVFPGSVLGGPPFVFSTADSLSLAGENPYDVAVGDFNQDYRTDIVVAADGEPRGFFLFLGADGPPNFLPPSVVVVEPGAPANHFGKSILVTDMNNDGALDVVLARENAAVTVSPGNGDGTFAAPVTALGPIDALDNFLWPLRMTTFDLEGDGDRDLLVMNGRVGNVTVVRNDGNMSFTHIQNFLITEGGGTQISAGDLDHDGFDEVVWTTVGGVMIAPNDGSGALGTATFLDMSPGIAGNSLLYDVEVVDLDLDGDLDILGALPGAPNAFLAIGVNDGAGNITVAGHEPLPLNGPFDTALADFDGDLRTDIAVLEGTGTVYIFRNETITPGQFEFSDVYHITTGLITFRIRNSNFDRDCDHDLVVVSRNSGSILVIKNLSPQHSQCTVADLDHDGTIGGGDIAILLSAWGQTASIADLDYSGRVEGWDLAILLWAWQQPSPRR